MSAIETLAVFAASFLVGAVGVHMGARVFTHLESYRRPLAVAAAGGVVWAVGQATVGSIPLLGPLLALGGYLVAVAWLYPGGRSTAGGIALVAWLASWTLLFCLGEASVAGFETFGLPGA